MFDVAHYSQKKDKEFTFISTEESPAKTCVKSQYMRHSGSALTGAQRSELRLLDRTAQKRRWWAIEQSFKWWKPHILSHPILSNRHRLCHTVQVH